jgi:hypothetical protein
MAGFPLQTVGVVAPFTPPALISAGLNLTFGDFNRAHYVSSLRRIWYRIYMGNPRSAIAYVRVSRDGESLLECTATLEWLNDVANCHALLRADALRHVLHVGDMLEIVSLGWRVGRPQ